MTQEYFEKLKRYYKIKFIGTNHGHTLCSRRGVEDLVLRKKLTMVGYIINMMDSYAYDYKKDIIKTDGTKVADTVIDINNIDDSDMGDILGGLNKLLSVHLYKNFE